jgi:hypothetical protein
MREMRKLNLGKPVLSNGLRKGNKGINVNICCSTDIAGELGHYVEVALSSISQSTGIRDITLNDDTSITTDATCEIEFNKTTIEIMGIAALDGYHLPNVALLLILAHKEIFGINSKISVRAKYYNQHKNLRYTKGGYDIFPYIDSMKNLVKQWVKNNPSEVEALKNVLCEINIGTHDFIPIIQ